MGLNHYARWKGKLMWSQLDGSNLTINGKDSSAILGATETKNTKTGVTANRPESSLVLVGSDGKILTALP